MLQPTCDLITSVVSAPPENSPTNVLSVDKKHKHILGTEVILQSRFIDHKLSPCLMDKTRGGGWGERESKKKKVYKSGIKIREYLWVINHELMKTSDVIRNGQRIEMADL